MEKKPYGYWNVKENCILEAKNYKTLLEWSIKSSGSYQSAKRNDWLDECSLHMKKLFRWTLELCMEDAKKYKTRSEWKRNSMNCYSASRRNGWYDQCVEHMVSLGNRKKRMVYCYIFPDKNVYVGLTGNENKRKTDHLVGDSGEKLISPVLKHINETNLIPQYIKISDYILETEARKIEILTIEQYKDNGYNLLNKVKGGSLGGNYRIWNEEKCIEVAKQYKTRTDWKRNSKGSHEFARTNGILEKCCSHMNNIKPVGYWNIKENCIEDAKKYKTRGEWNKKSGGAYKSARLNKWLDDCLPYTKIKI